MDPQEPILYALHARRLLASLKGKKIISRKTLALLVNKEGLRSIPDPYGSGRRVFLESDIRAWWAKKLEVSARPMPGPGRPRKVQP